MERLGVLDAGFWYLEDKHAALHIASINVFEGPTPRFDEIVEAIARKLPELPRYRMKLRSVPFGLARPVWIDDVHFDLSFHVRRTALPSPGGDEQLRALTERLMAQRLDLDHPLWETWFVEGLPDGKWAVIWKIHHSLVDGVGGMAMLSTMLEAAPDSALPPAHTWTPHPEPSSVQLVAAALQDGYRAGIQGARGATSALRSPLAAIRTMAGGARGLARYATAARPVARTSLVGPIESSRRYTWTEVEISDVGSVRKELGGSLNDVVLTIVTRGFRVYLLRHGEWPGEHAVRCLVPVSVRKVSDGHGCDNHVSALLVELPTQLEDVLETHRAVVAHTTDLKSSYEAAAGELLLDLASYLPNQVIGGALRTAFGVPQQFVSTVTTNVPGPRWPLYLLGRRMLAMYPYVPIADRLRIGVAVTSYDGRLYFGITSDRDSITDIETLTDGIDAGMNGLLDAVLVKETSL